MNNTLKFALYIVGFSLIWLIGEKLLGYQNIIVDWLPFTSLLWLILVGAAYIIFLRAERRQGRSTEYGPGVKSLLRLTLYWLLVFSVIKWFYYSYLNPDYFNDLLIRGREWLTLSATSEENFENATRMIEDFLETPAYLAVTATVQFLFCLIYSLLFPSFSRKK